MVAQKLKPESRADFGILLGLAYQAFVDQLRADLERRGFADLTPTVGYVVRAIAASAEPPSQRDLAAHLGITDQGAGKIVNDLVARGFVTRRPSPRDTRANAIQLAARGRKLLAAARRFHARFETALASEVGADADVTRRVLTAIAAAADDSAAGRLRAT
ncbi:MAG: MarR family transcriptional regulator [Thermoanaerobaculia bacterium]|nr:MarR family transcriptional regulator [Thermoanaerobaculia bacterium]MBP9823605.1 MarR family transcriptional regulator [Thermoanaerobaculia bacterium]